MSQSIYNTYKQYSINALDNALYECEYILMT